MPENDQIALEQEPIGIVIASGRREELAPRFSAYIWGVSQETDDPDRTEVLSVAAA